jgi:hypothetical protein
MCFPDKKSLAISSGVGYQNAPKKVYHFLSHLSEDATCIAGVHLLIPLMISSTAPFDC